MRIDPRLIAFAGFVTAATVAAACGSVAVDGEPIPSTTIALQVPSPSTSTTTTTISAPGAGPRVPEVAPLETVNPSDVSTDGPFVILRGSIDGAAVDELARIEANQPNVDTLVFADVNGATDLETTQAAAAIVKRSGWVNILASDYQVSGDAVYVFLSSKIHVVEAGGRVIPSSWCCTSDGLAGIDVPPGDPAHGERISMIRGTVGLQLGPDFYWMAQRLGRDNQTPLTAALLESFDLTHKARQVTGPPRNITQEVVAIVGQPDVERLVELVRLMAAELPTELEGSDNSVDRLSGEILHISPGNPARTRILIDGNNDPTVRGEILLIEIEGNKETGWKIESVTSTALCRNSTNDSGQCR